MKITFVTVSATAIKQLIETGRYITENYGHVLDLKLYYAAAELEDKSFMK